MRLLTARALLGCAFVVLVVACDDGAGSSPAATTLAMEGRDASTPSLVAEAAVQGTTSSTRRDATIGVELSPAMEEYVAAIEDVCIAQLPPSADPAETPAAAFDRHIAHLGEKVAALESITPPAEEAAAARRYVIEPHKTYYQNMLHHRDALMAAAELGREQLLRELTVLEVSPGLDDAGATWIRENGAGDCGFSRRR